jgi:hypothetical protein
MLNLGIDRETILDTIKSGGGGGDLQNSIIEYISSIRRLPGQSYEKVFSQDADMRSPRD